MENQALVSVIIPVYNVENYLRECVESVLTQTYENLEIILVDDGSTDSSGAICDEYLDKDMRVTVIHQKNGGLSAARNAGFESCEGDYVYFLDSDDYIAPDTVKKLLGNALDNSSDIVYFDALSFEDPDNFSMPQNYKRKKQYKTADGYSVLTELTENKEYHSAVPLLFINKKFMAESGIGFIPAILHEDMVFTYQLFCKAQTVSQCDEALYFRRYRSNSIMTSAKSLKHFTSCIAVYDNIRSFSETEIKENRTTADKYISRCAFNVFNTYEALDSKDKKSSKKELKAFRKDVLSHKAFGDKALKMRCHGKSFWFIYKVLEKTVGRLAKGTK